ncbi:MAG: UDP-N-acetylmuramate--L-alanine ligase, partial [Actinomycetia bacterium]|nr:UDP-N-acetylmuramate--L-alanine ligase [Actinomycetes bacterium]
PFYGCTVLCLDHPVIQELLPKLERRYVSFGLSTQADVHAEGIEHSDGATSFTLMSFGKRLGQVRLNMPGVHNIQNALASIAVAIELGIDVSDIIKALGEFKGVERRFQVKTKSGSSVMVVDDYGHHPIEIKAVLKAVKDGFRMQRIITVFQPHRYSRLAHLKNEFSLCFDEADILIITEVYGSGEQPIPGINGKFLIDSLIENGFSGKIAYIPGLLDIAEYLNNKMKQGDIVLLMGAGDITRVSDELFRN